MGVWDFNFTASFLHTMMPFPPAAPVFSNVEQWKVGPEKTDCLLVLSRSVVKIKETVSWAHRGWYLAYIRCWMVLSSLRAVPGSFWLETMCCSVVSSYFLNTQDKSEQRELIDLTNRLTSWMVNEQMNLDIFNQFSCPSHTSPPGTTFVTEKRKSESASRSVMSESLQPPWTVARQAPLFMEFSRQEYWRGLPCRPPGDLPCLGIKARHPALQVNFFPTWAIREAPSVTKFP